MTYPVTIVDDFFDDPDEIVVDDFFDEPDEV